MDGRRHQSQPRVDFDRFIAETAEPMLRSAYLITWDFAEAEDLVQECLFRVARRRPRVKKMERPIAYEALSEWVLVQANTSVSQSEAAFSWPGTVSSVIRWGVGSIRRA